MAEAAFDPFEMPAQLKVWLAKASDAEVHRHASAFAKRAVAARDVLDALALLRRASEKYQHPYLDDAIEKLTDVAQQAHDYDPTSD